MAPDDPGAIAPEACGYRVNDLRIDVRRQCVTQAGIEIALSPRSFAFLLALVRAAPDVRSVAQLMEQVWPGVVVGPETISQRVKIVREALGDSARAPRYIAGVRGRGYCVAAPVAPWEPSRRPLAAEREVSSMPTRLPWFAATLILLIAALAWWNGSSPGTDALPESLPESLPEQGSAAASDARTSIAGLPLADPSVGQPPSAADADTLAHERYLKARFFYNRRAEGDVARAKQYYLEALALAPRDARAWAGLAAVYGLEFGRGGASRRQVLAKQRQAAERAVALDPQLAEARSRLAHYFRNAGDWNAAAREYLEALALDGDDPLTLSSAAGMALAEGKLAEAIELEKRAVSADPTAYVYQANLGAYLAAAGRLEEAETELVHALELNPEPTPSDTIDDVRLETVLAQVLILSEQLDSALTLVDRLPAGPDRDQCLALIEHARGRDAATRAPLERLAADYNASGAVRLAEVHAHWGNIDKAFEWLESARERIRGELQSSPDYPHKRWWAFRATLRVSPLMRPLHDDSRWESLLAAD